MIEINIDKLNDIALQAGKAILEVYNSPNFEVELKGDNSPLTLADRRSNEIIVKGLKSLSPDIPILSEEGKNIPYETRKNWEYFWLVDPLDGTKEFIKRNGEFTVNIALIEKNNPVLGVVYSPALNLLYYAKKDDGAFKIDENGNKSEIKANKNIENGLIAVKSRSHSSVEEDEFFKQFNIVDSINVGSSLKFCMVAEGKAHIYYRHGPTMEWDTGAGHIIAEASGATVKNLDGTKMLYNKEVIRNPSFVVKSF